jgi:hypothetical protein
VIETTSDGIDPAGALMKETSMKLVPMLSGLAIAVALSACAGKAPSASTSSRPERD